MNIDLNENFNNLEGRLVRKLRKFGKDVFFVINVYSVFKFRFCVRILILGGYSDSFYVF